MVLSDSHLPLQVMLQVVAMLKLLHPVLASTSAVLATMLIGIAFIAFSVCSFSYSGVWCVWAIFESFNVGPHKVTIYLQLFL